MAYILCLGNARWQARPNRTQYFLRYLSQHHKILYFQPPPVKFSRDPHRKEYKERPKKLQKNLFVCTLPPVFDVTDYQHPRRLNYSMKRMNRYIQEKAAQLHMNNPLLWLCSPFYAGLVETLNYKGLIYDCFRDWSRFDIRWESIIANRADVLFAASPGLVDHLEPCNNNIALIPNGGDYRLYVKTEDLTLQVPAPLLRIRGPMFGYLGDVSPRVDLVPVFRAAKAHPAWSFVFAGRCSKANPLCQAIKSLPNVHFLGKINPLDLPGYGAQFDVLIDLLDTDDPDEDVVPSRIYEYLVIGKPIAAMYPLRYIPVYPDIIYGAHSPKEFADACYQAVMENSAWAPAKRKRSGEEAAWPRRCESVELVLENNGLI